MRLRKTVSGLMLALGLVTASIVLLWQGGGHASSASAQAPFAFSVDMDADGAVGNVQASRTVNVGSSFTVEVEVTGIPAPGFAGYAITLNFDPAVLTTSPGQLADLSGMPNQIVKQVTGGNTIEIAFVDLADPLCGTPGPSPYEGQSQALLAKITFTAVSAATVTLELDVTANEVALCDASTSPPDIFNNGVVAVTGAPTNTPTHTPQPTNTPTPTATPCRVNGVPCTPTATNTPTSTSTVGVGSTATPTRTPTPVATPTAPAPATPTREVAPATRVPGGPTAVPTRPTGAGLPRSGSGSSLSSNNGLPMAVAAGLLAGGMWLLTFVAFSVRRARERR